MQITIIIINLNEGKKDIKKEAYVCILIISCVLVYNVNSILFSKTEL